MEMVQCPYCKTGNRLGKSLCRKCMRGLPKVEEVMKERTISIPKKKIKVLENSDNFEKISRNTED